jgi:hypothetical protein
MGHDHHAGVEYKPGTDPAKFVKNMQGWASAKRVGRTWRTTS